MLCSSPPPCRPGLPMPTLARLLAASTHRERVAGRRLARRSGLSDEAALRDVLTTVAGTQTLLMLVAARESENAQAAARLALRREQKAAARLAIAAARKPDPAAWLAWFDGSSHPNPGRLGIGARLQAPTGEATEICRPAGHGDSNEAEFLALIAVLEAALAAGAMRLVVYGDSRVVLDALAQPDKQPVSAHLRILCETARQRAAQFGELRLCWIPRHRNGAADALSQRAVGMSG